MLGKNKPQTIMGSKHSVLYSNCSSCSVILQCQIERECFVYVNRLFAEQWTFFSLLLTCGNMERGKYCLLILWKAMDAVLAHCKRDLSLSFRLIDIVGNLKIQIQIDRRLERQI